ncbi:hypothetical protein LTR85_011644 [Meristemomyces frigidus]|nr:hypothetical protein LTR85_011644 [Meristemomyces frigidus]
MHSVFFVQAALLLTASFVSGQGCIDTVGCDGLFPIDDGAGGDCGVDPDDGSDFALPATICPCANGETLVATVRFTGTDGAVTSSTSAAALGPSATLDTLNFDYPNANTAISSGSPVTVFFSVDQGAYDPYIFTYSPVSSIFFTAETDTIATTTNTVVTTTSTATVTSTTEIPQVTTTNQCTTGTSTVTASTLTQHVTSTITPAPKTKKAVKVSFSTTHASCLPPPKSNGKRSAREQVRAEIAERQVNVGTFEAPYCPDQYGPPASTTYTTATSVVTSTVTTTDTSTSIQTSTITTTSTPTPLTTSVCYNVAATTTTTPSVTSTAFTTAKQSTVTSTHTYTFVYTIFPPHATLCTKLPPKTYSATTTGKCMKPSSTKT